jgi:hypothetical protein
MAALLEMRCTTADESRETEWVVERESSPSDDTSA